MLGSRLRRSVCFPVVLVASGWSLVADPLGGGGYHRAGDRLDATQQKLMPAYMGVQVRASGECFFFRSDGS
jgi:hypothetical protein